MDYYLYGCLGGGICYGRCGAENALAGPFTRQSIAALMPHFRAGNERWKLYRIFGDDAATAASVLLWLMSR